MKTTKRLMLSLWVLCLFSSSIIAQQMFHVHEDVVKPGMTMEYENILAEVGKLLENNPIEDTNMMVLQGNNNHYYFINPISSMADLDKPSPPEKLANKAGGDAVWPLFQRMDKCYDIERDYIVTLVGELSYMPNGMTLTPEGQNYREQYKIYFTPGNRSVVTEKIEAVKKMFVDKNSKMHYRVYKSGFGAEREFYLVSIAAKNEMHMAELSKANEDLMGEAGQNTMWEMFKNIQHMEEIEGRMRPDLAYKSE
jgi:hypothetical protein